MALKLATWKDTFSERFDGYKCERFCQNFFFWFTMLICLHSKHIMITFMPKYVDTITKESHISEIRWNLSTKMPIFIENLQYLVNGLRFGFYYGLRFRSNRFKHSVKRFGRFGLDTLLQSMKQCYNFLQKLYIS